MYDAPGAATYLSKYFAKEFGEREEMKARGFRKRWSRSRSWPTDKREMIGKKEGWISRGYYSERSHDDSLPARLAKEQKGRVEFTMEDLGAGGQLDGKIHRRQLAAQLNKLSKELVEV